MERRIRIVFVRDWEKGEMGKIVKFYTFSPIK
jgi:hypothetical protein